MILSPEKELIFNKSDSVHIVVRALAEVQAISQSDLHSLPATFKLLLLT